MSFTDLMGSAKGPGVIGMLLAMLVLVGFGSLYMFVFQDEMNGEKSLASIVRDNEQSIERYQSRVSSAKKEVETLTPLRRQTSAELVETTAKAGNLVNLVKNARDEIASLESEVEELEEDFENYKNRYRAHVRNKAAGTRIEQLVTTDGTTYHKVDIRKVTAVGIEVRHRDGHKRIGFEELPQEMQDHYQFDKNQMVAELQREAKIRKKHNRAVAVASEAAERAAEEQRAEDEERLGQRKLEEIAAKEARLQMIEREIGQLESDIANAESAAAAARSAGRMHLSKGGSLRGNLNAKRNEYARLAAEIARLRSSI